MGLFDRLFGEIHVPDADGVRVLDVPSAMNLRDLGGYETPDGPTVARRFLRCGSTRCISQKDRSYLRSYGLTHVLDLRGSGESPELTCPYAREHDITWRNVTLLGQNLSDPAFAAAQQNMDYLSRGYLAMLENHETIRQAMAFLASVPFEECALFHCAAGMDRTGVVAMLLLGLAGVSRTDIVRDYLYSFASVREVDRFVAEGAAPESFAGSRLMGRLDTMGKVYDAVIESYVSFAAYLLACELTQAELDQLRRRLLTPAT
ncbi:MAG: tyrosine-protein phosphatase [Atopobiaceae bacterium]|nr:tyrosine-protein phosphatase [Atopobiaceae bacterium]